jgi:hypothetical protein
VTLHLLTTSLYNAFQSFLDLVGVLDEAGFGALAGAGARLPPKSIPPCHRTRVHQSAPGLPVQHHLTAFLISLLRSEC